MTRVVGSLERDEFEDDPVRAWQRGRRIDALGACLHAMAPRGVWRGTHAHFNRIDDERSLAMARRVNGAIEPKPTAES